MTVEDEIRKCKVELVLIKNFGKTGELRLDDDGNIKHEEDAPNGQRISYRNLHKRMIFLNKEINKLNTKWHTIQKN